MTIGALAEKADVNVETVRYYQRVGLLKEPSKPPSGYRKYTGEDLERLLFIRRAKNLGFSLADIGGLLSLPSSPESCTSACSVAERHLQDVRQRIQELTTLQRQLEQMLGCCQQKSGCVVLRALSGSGLTQA